MSIESYLNFTPAVSMTAFVAPNASLIGRITIGESSSIWYHTTLRGDVNSIKIGSQSNIQDNSVLHNSDDFPCVIGHQVTIGHSCIVHACTIHNSVLVGMGSTILDGSVVGTNSIIGANSLVTKGTIIPPNSLFLGSPGKVIRSLTDKEQESIKALATKYVKLSRQYLEVN